MYEDEMHRRMAQVQKKVHNATWHDLSLWVARLVLLVFFSLWVRSYWADVAPVFFYADATGRLVSNAAVIATGALDAFLALGLAVASATVPAIFLSGLIPNSPASTLLAGLDYKYGRPGFYFALIGAVIFTTQGGMTMHSYWMSRPAVVAEGPLSVAIHTVVSLMLMVGFPAWCLNRLTPEQWVDAITQARQVARIKRLLALEDMAEKAIITRARTLLYMDVSQLTLEQRGANNREVAAILAAAERGMAESLRQVSGTFKSLYHMELVTQTDDGEIVQRYKGLADYFEGAHAEVVDYVNIAEDRAVDALAVVRAGVASDQPLALRPRSTVAHQDAETGDRNTVAGDRERGPWRPVAAPAVDRERPQAQMATPEPVPAEQRETAYMVAVQMGGKAWKRSEIEDMLAIEKTKALAIISDWLAANLIVRLANPRDHYSFLAPETWPAGWQRSEGGA